MRRSLCLHGNRYPAYIRELKRESAYVTLEKNKYYSYIAINTFYLKKVFLIQAFVVLR